MERDAAAISVTEATNADVDAFATFFWEAWRQAGPDAPGFVGASDKVIADLTTAEAFGERIGGPERRMFLAWEDERVVGFAATKRVNADKGYRNMIVLTETVNDRARTFYEARNFAVTGSDFEYVEGATVEVSELTRDLR